MLFNRSKGSESLAEINPDIIRTSPNRLGRKPAVFDYF